MSVKSNQATNVSSTDTTTEKQTFPYPLIDVDCNLLHSDLVSLPQEPTSTNNAPPSTNKYLHILHHPSVSLSNIQGIFSPSSTIDEAEEFHSVLMTSTNDCRNGIDIRQSVGVHPYHVNEISNGKDFPLIETQVKERMDALLALDKETRYISCIGETGLDYSDGFPDKEDQLPWFQFQLQMAKEANLPLFIHERLAFRDTLRLIDQVFSSSSTPPPPIIIHCFTGTKEECQEYAARGYYFSVSGFILKNNDGAEEVKACLRDGIMSLDRLMIETDAPYMGFSNSRDLYYEIEQDENEAFQSLNSKKRKRLLKSIYPNVPSALLKVFECVVTCINEGRIERGELPLTMEQVAQKLLQNSQDFFRFPQD